MPLATPETQLATRGAAGTRGGPQATDGGLLSPCLTTEAQRALLGASRRASPLCTLHRDASRVHGRPLPARKGLPTDRGGLSLRTYIPLPPRGRLGDHTGARTASVRCDPAPAPPPSFHRRRDRRREETRDLGRRDLRERRDLGRRDLGRDLRLGRRRVCSRSATFPRMSLFRSV